MRGFASNWPTLQALIKTSDIVIVQEHWLHAYEADRKMRSLGDINANIACFDSWDETLPTNRFRGEKGTAIIWHNNLESCGLKIKVIDNISDTTSRITAVLLTPLKGNKTCLINVYMPSRGRSCSEANLLDTFDKVSAIISTYRSTCDVILAGDFNASLHRSPPNSHDRLLKDFCRENQLELCQDYPSTPTFRHSNGEDKSTIDYFLMGTWNRLKMLDVQVLENEQDAITGNTSDHAPVTARVEMDLLSPSPYHRKRRKKERIRWDRGAAHVYEDEVRRKLDEIEVELSSGLNIDWALHLLHSTLNEAGRLHMSIKRFASSKMRSRSSTVAALHQTCKHAFFRWKVAGRPYGDHPSFGALKETKRRLRQQVRQEEFIRDDNLKSKIMDDFGINPINYYKLINRQRSASTITANRLVYNGTEYEGAKDVCRGFSTYFAKLGKPKVSELFYDDHRINVEADVAILQDGFAQQPHSTVITEADVRKAIKELHPGKAPDGDGISAEHLLYAKEAVVPFLTELFNGILLLNHIPGVFLNGNIRPIWKKKGTTDDPTKYRGITISSTIGKVFEGVLAAEVDKAFVANQSKLQYGFTAKTSILATSFLLAEATSSNRQVVATFLDAEKACDVVWQGGLLRKLALLNIPADIWKAVSQWYCNISASVEWNEEVSEEFAIRQGVRQGGRSSPLLYKIFLNDMLLELEKKGAGLSIGSISVACPTVADDVLLLAESEMEAQDLLNTVEVYTRLNRYSINPAKSEVLVYHGKGDQDINLILDTEVLKLSNRATHIGMLQGPGAGLNKERAQHNVNLARKALYSLRGVKILRGMNPAVGYSMFCQYVEPILLYSTEVWVKSQQAYLILDRFYLKSLKLIQGLPDRTATVAVITLLGALPIRAKIHCRRLSLLWNLIHSEDFNTHELVSRQYLLGSKNSWVTETVDLLDFYHLPSLGELLADLPSKHEWKKQVKDVITCHWYGKMAEEIPEKSSLKFLSTQTEHLSHIHPVWQTTISDSWRSQHARTRVKLLTGTYTLQANLARFNQNDVIPTCKLCRENPEDRVHFVAVCSELQVARDSAFEEFRLISDSSLYQRELREAWEVDSSRAMLLLNPFQLGIISVESLTEVEVTKIEKCVTSLCHFLHRDRWQKLLSL